MSQYKVHFTHKDENVRVEAIYGAVHLSIPIKESHMEMTFSFDPGYQPSMNEIYLAVDQLIIDKEEYLEATKKEREDNEKLAEYLNKLSL